MDARSGEPIHRCDQPYPRSPMHVDVKSSAKDRGKIEIYYDSLDELERILNRVRVEA